MALFRPAKVMAFVGSNTITSPTHQATIENSPKLGNFALLPLEVRNNIYSRLLDDDFEQVHEFDTDGSIVFEPSKCSAYPPFLEVNQTLCEEMDGALTAGRHCKVRIERQKIVTNFSMHSFAKDETEESHKALMLPTCKRIEITIDPPSPREAQGFYQLRQNIQSFISLINSKARDVNPQVCVELDRTGLQYTYSYNDFAMFFGPFVGLSSRCKAAMLFRTTGLPVFHPTVESYCNLIEAAMTFVPEARRELTLHQCQIDLKLPIALLRTSAVGPSFYGVNSRETSEVLTMPLELSVQQLGTMRIAASSMMRLYHEQELLLPAWACDLFRHLFETKRPRKMPKNLQAVVLEGQTIHGQKANDMRLWAAGLISRFNPIFDDVKFFRGEEAEGLSAGGSSTAMVM